jgi:signal transduction histidine kinase
LRLRNGDFTPGETIKQLRVLLLEDSTLDADLITASLYADGMECDVECVQTRQEFVRALDIGGISVILSDYSLPGFDGMTALELATEMQPGVPFIFVSGYLGEDLAIETLKRGATDYVLKSRLDRLVPSVQRALREAKEREERSRIETSLRLLSNASLVLSSLDYSTTMTRVAQLAVPHFADICLVDIRSENGTIERVAVAVHDEGRSEAAQKLLEYAPRTESLHPAQIVLQEGKSQLISDIPANFLESSAHDARHLETIRQLDIQSVMVVPLRADGHILGAMTFISTSAERRYELLDVALAEDLALRCAQAVENARLHRKTVDALRARDEFLAVLSHELRSPLTSILGWVQILQEDDLQKETLAQGLTVIERNTRVQVQLIQELLEVSRIITGRLRLEMAPVQVSDIINNVVDLMAPTAQAKGVLVDFVNEANGSLVLGDEPRLQQVFWNLASNALKFTPKAGHVEITLSRSDDFVSVRVKDSGEGISSEFLPYVFDRFRQANSSSTRQHGGLGLGLAIVRHLTEMHGGSVTAESEGEGRGAAFTVRLPLRAALVDSSETNEAQQARSGEENAHALHLSSLEGVQVLIVEDGDDARAVLEAILQRAGAQVKSASSVSGAMSALEGYQPDVIVSDIGMPDEDGYALMQRLKEWELKSKIRLPAVALTAYASEQDRLRALSAGFRAHLPKPVEPSLLIATIATVIRD